MIDKKSELDYQIYSLNYSINHAQPEDATALVDFLNKAGGESDNLSFGENEFSYSIEQEKIYINNVINNRNGAILLAKDQEGKLIGETSCVKSLRRQDHIFTIGVTVAKEYWGNGIGSALLDRIILKAEKLGCKKLMLYVYRHNEKAVKIYHKLGFEIEGTLRRDAFINNLYVDTHIMSKFLY